MPIDSSRRDWFAVDWDADPGMQEEYRRSIHSEVDAVCKSETFADQKILRKLLRAIVMATLAGKPHRETTLALEVWGKSLESWNPSEKNLVRANVRRLRERLTHYYREEEADAHRLIEIDIPKGAYAAKITVFDPDRRPDIMHLPVNPLLEPVDLVFYKGEVIPGAQFDATHPHVFALSPSVPRRKKRTIRKK
jgi:hypothetical protein